MEKHKLTVKKRTIVGKKVKKLRAQGELPGNIYGKSIKSETVSVALKDFRKVYHKAGETGLVYLTIEGETKERPVLLHNLQKDPVKDSLLHVDFYQVDLKEKVTAKIPISAVGEAKAVTDKIGVLLQPLAEVEVKALPADLPEKIEIDVSKLAQVDESLSVKDLKVDKAKIELLSNPDEIIVKIGPLITKEVEEQLAAEKVAAEAATQAAATAAPEETAEAAVAPGKEAPPSEVKPEETKKKPESTKS